MGGSHEATEARGEAQGTNGGVGVRSRWREECDAKTSRRRCKRISEEKVAQKNESHIPHPLIPKMLQKKLRVSEHYIRVVQFARDLLRSTQRDETTENKALMPRVRDVLAA